MCNRSLKFVILWFLKFVGLTKTFDLFENQKKRFVWPKAVDSAHRYTVLITISEGIKQQKIGLIAIIIYVNDYKNNCLSHAQVDRCLFTSCVG